MTALVRGTVMLHQIEIHAQGRYSHHELRGVLHVLTPIQILKHKGPFGRAGLTVIAHQFSSLLVSSPSDRGLGYASSTIPNLLVCLRRCLVQVAEVQVQFILLLGGIWRQISLKSRIILLWRLLIGDNIGKDSGCASHIAAKSSLLLEV